LLLLNRCLSWGGRLFHIAGFFSKLFSFRSYPRIEGG
jgi:hypothetical protein